LSEVPIQYGLYIAPKTIDVYQSRRDGGLAQRPFFKINTTHLNHRLSARGSLIQMKIVRELYVVVHLISLFNGFHG
jgi:hypothetical protein